MYDPLLVLSGNKYDFGRENIVNNTYLFYQVCKVHDIVYFRDQSVNAKKSSHLWHFIPKTSLSIKFLEKFGKDLAMIW